MLIKVAKLDTAITDSYGDHYKDRIVAHLNKLEAEGLLYEDIE